MTNFTLATLIKIQANMLMLLKGPYFCQKFENMLKTIVVHFYTKVSKMLKKSVFRGKN